MSDFKNTDGVDLRSEMKFFALLVAVLMTFGVGRLLAQSNIENLKVDARVEDFALEGGTKMDLIEGMEESEVIAQLKVVRDRYDAIYSYGDSKAMSSDEALLRMGDEETILRLMDQYHKGQGHGESVLMAANEKALKFLIEDVRSGSEESRRRASDSWGPSIRIASTTKFLMILKRNAAFPEMTRKWADRTQTVVMGGSNHHPILLSKPFSSGGKRTKRQYLKAVMPMRLGFPPLRKKAPRRTYGHREDRETISAKVCRIASPRMIAKF